MGFHPVSGVAQIIVIVIIGGIAGWLSATVLRERRLSILGYMVVGIVGSFIGFVLFRQFDIPITDYQIGPVPVGHLIAAFFGSILLVLLLRWFRGRRY